jgi:hypothetical protein
MKIKRSILIKPSNLLPCPFCGGEAEEVVDLVHSAIRCSNCFVQTKFYAAPLSDVVMKEYGVDVLVAIELQKIIRRNRAAEMWNSRIDKKDC